MPKKTNETHREYRERMIDTVSSSFCAAKWLNATIWLGHGETTSCHHPPAQQINVDSIKDNPSGIHNTTHKKEMRQMMLDGKRPEECEYCWKIEDMAKDADGQLPVSDRTFKTVIYDDADIIAISKADPYDNVIPKTLEVAFNRTCNFACSYCNPEFSTTWAKDIKNNGIYTELYSEGRGAFSSTADWAEPYARNEVNPYIDAFWEWWPELSQELEEIRVTGGEPTMTPDIYKLFDWFEENADTPQAKKMRLAINSNLGAKDELIDKLIAGTQNINHFHLYTSCEAVGAQAEYIRDGLDWNKFVANFERVISEGNIECMHVMMTINALCLTTIVDFFEWMLEMKRTYGHNKPLFTCNILRFPSFQSVHVLPESIRKIYHLKIYQWLSKTRDIGELDANGHKLLQPLEEENITRLIEYLDVVKTPHSHAAENKILINDFKSFYSQYDLRRGKNFRETFPELADFFNDI